MKKILLSTITSMVLFNIMFALSFSSYNEENDIEVYGDMHKHSNSGWVNKEEGNLFGDSRFNLDADPRFNLNADPRFNLDADPRFNLDADPRFNLDADPRFNLDGDTRYNPKTGKKY